MKKEKKKLKPIYHVFDGQGDNPTMCECFFDENFKFITGWHENDANWREEYMGGLIEHTGYQIVYPKPKIIIKNKLIEKIREEFGFEEENEEE